MEFLQTLRTSVVPPWLFAAVLCLPVAALSVWWGALNQDEGWYLYAAQSVRMGLMPYRDFFFTQGPSLPYVYAVLADLWSPFGVLGGRVLTLAFGLLGSVFAVAIARRLVAPERRAAVSVAVFTLLAGNLYHVYFNTIPKTYALGGAFVMAGFYCLVRAFGAERPVWRHVFAALCGLALAFATGTRISLLLILPVVGVGLCLGFRRWRWLFLSFGAGGALGLLVTYGPFAFQPDALRGLLAAQGYHAARGGFDAFFAIGSVSRLSRGYAALGAVLFVLLARLVWRVSAEGVPVLSGDARAAIKMMGASFAAVFCLQLSAPFPYDDYQVPLMGLLTLVITVPFVSGAMRPLGAAWFALLAAGLASFTSPMLQDWTAYPPDRFWSHRKPKTELAGLREVARRVEALDPKGGELLTQDLYLAVECRRRVPAGLEMGPFSYFPGCSDAEAARLHVHNRASLERLLDSAPTAVAAFSGYGFAISAPTTAETPFEEQKHFFTVLHRRYDLVESVPDFGQNATTLLVLKKKEAK